MLIKIIIIFSNWENEHHETIAKNLALILKTSVSVFWNNNKGRIYEKFKNYTHRCAELQGITKKRQLKHDNEVNTIKRPRFADGK